jgi:hypothetical protein
MAGLYRGPLSYLKLTLETDSINPVFSFTPLTQSENICHFFPIQFGNQQQQWVRAGRASEGGDPSAPEKKTDD